MHQKNYPKIFEFVRWSAVASFAVCFVIINVVVFYLLKDVSLNHKRLHSPTSYGEIKNKIELVEKDPNKKIIFLGASAMWGAPGITDAEETVPFQFAKKIEGDVSVYNFSFPAAHPLDILIMSVLLKNKADLFFIDINSDYLKADSVIGAKEDRRKYLRVYKLLSANYRAVFSESSEVQQCLKQYGLVQPYEAYFDISSYIPLLKYKDEVNYLVLGKPFQQFFANILNGMLEFFKTGEKQVVWKDIFKQHEDFPVKSTRVNTEKVVALSPSINSCVSQAISSYFVKNNIPAIFYLSPHSPEATRLERSQAQYKENKRFIANLYAGTLFIDLDTVQPITSSDFIDETHFNKTGHAALAEKLFEFMNGRTVFSNIFK